MGKLFQGRSWLNINEIISITNYFQVFTQFRSKFLPWNSSTVCSISKIFYLDFLQAIETRLKKFRDCRRPVLAISDHGCHQPLVCQLQMRGRLGSPDAWSRRCRSRSCSTPSPWTRRSTRRRRPRFASRTRSGPVGRTCPERVEQGFTIISTESWECAQHNFSGTSRFPPRNCPFWSSVWGRIGGMGIEGGSAHLIGLREHNSKRKSLVRLSRQY